MSTCTALPSTRTKWRKLFTVHDEWRYETRRNESVVFASTVVEPMHTGAGGSGAVYGLNCDQPPSKNHPSPETTDT